mgnify:CR=1 FL=1
MRRHPWLTSALVLAVVLTLFFAGRFVIGAVYWAQHQQEPIRGWMTVGYIGKSWNLDPREIDAVAGFPLPRKRQCQPGGWHYALQRNRDHPCGFCMCITIWGKGISTPSASKVSFTFSWKSNQTPQ